MTASRGDYELLDFGDDRKLERFGDVVLDRPSPAAQGKNKAQPGLWGGATARYQRSPGDVLRVRAGEWTPPPRMWLPPDWCFVHHGAPSLRLALKALPSGQVGVFPEQRENWNWIAQQTACGLASKQDLPFRVLNLFAYTGGSTLAAAAAGADVVHIDAAGNMVERARENAVLSGLSDRPIRWITEDAQKFCRRELKRGNRYDAVILDPPSYGHGPKGEPWKIDQHLLSLLKLCGELTAESRAFVLVTCHSPSIGTAELAAYVAEGIFGHCGQPPTAGKLFLETADGRRLPSGVFARWPTT